MELDKNIYYGNLFSLYKPLLTERKRTICEAFYEQNLGLSEIAENLNISRQAVLDTLKKANTQLEETEAKLKLEEKLKKVSASVDDKTKNKINEIMFN